MCCSSVIAGPVDSQQAQKAAETFLKARNDRASKGFEPLSVTSEVEPGPVGLREIRGDEPDSHGDRINMGAFGGTPKASKSL
ncbi:MAG: hypothetical protein A2Z38_08010 [Planctomycetes bacterium RBG_19FT_COMBO_48_8]|nr:MAG: hypothetical protein A2Z38_08010 [Planctomycetes bacterium RBG_19FT_COMBO_48_8]